MVVNGLRCKGAKDQPLWREVPLALASSSSSGPFTVQLTLATLASAWSNHSAHSPDARRVRPVSSIWEITASLFVLA